MYELIADAHIPQTGVCADPIAETLRVFVNFRYRIFNDGDDNFATNYRSAEVAAVIVSKDAPSVVQDFFNEARTFNATKYWKAIRALEGYEDARDAVNKEVRISYDRLDDILVALVPWVYSCFFPPSSPEEILARWEVVAVEQKARRAAEYAEWKAEEEERCRLWDLEREQIEIRSAEIAAAKIEVKKISMAKRAAKIEVKKISMAKRAATLLAKKSIKS